MTRSAFSSRLGATSALALVSLALLSSAARAQSSAPQAGPGQPQSPEVAQAQEPDQSRQVEQIIVTAQFREQNVQDTPIAITAVNSEMLEARSQTNIAQVANQAPSVTLQGQGASYGPSLLASIRGVGQYDYSPALEPGVGIYVDDVYYPTLTGSILDLLDLDRVEILRGPQGTLAGKNSIGGAVKLYSQRPEGTNTGSLSGTYGSRQRVDVRGAADFALTDTVSARLSGTAKHQDGYVDRLDFGCVYPAGGPATFVNDAGATVPVNPTGGVPRLTSTQNADCVIAKEGEVNFQALRGQLRYENDKLEINLIGDYTHDSRYTAGSVLRDFVNANGVRVSPAQTIPGSDMNPFAAAIPYDNRFLCGKYCNYATFYGGPDSGPAFALEGGVRSPTVYAGRVKYDGWGVSGQIEYELTDNLAITSISSYRAYETTFQNDDDLSPLAHTNNTNDLDFWVFTQELRLGGTLLDDTVNYTVGGYYLTQESRSVAISDLRYIPNYPIFATNDTIKADTKAVFANVSWQPIEPLTLTGGLRYTDEYKSYVFGRVTPAFTPLPAGFSLGLLDGTVGLYDGPTSDRIDYRLAAQYQVMPDVMVYGSVATGFKGGGVNPRPFNSAQAIGIGPETLTSYEVGVKTELFDRLMRLNVAGFISDYNGIQLSLSNCTALVGAANGIPCAALVNAGDARLKGIEVETTIRPVDGLLIDGALSYLGFDYKRFTNYGGAFAGGPNNPAGPQFGHYPPYTPEWKWSAGIQYDIALGNIGSLTPRVDASYQSKTFVRSNNGPTNLLPGYTVANARLTWRNQPGDLEIAAEVTNLFDEYYYLTGFDLTFAGAGFSTAQPGRPREWAVTIKKEF